MELELLKGISRLVASASPLEEKLAAAAELIVTRLKLDQAAIYLWAPKEGGLRLSALSGAPSAPGYYREGEGLAGEAVKRGVAVQWEHGAEADDPGLAGFKSAVACPIADARRVRGAVVVKSFGKGALTKRMIEALSVVALEAVHLLRYEDIIREHRSACRELRDAVGRLKKAEKLVYLGDMAAPLAHEIRNPLVSIGGLALRLKKTVPPDTSALKYAEAIINETGRLERIVEGAMRFLKQSALDLKADDMNALLDDTLAVFEEDMRECGITVVREYHDGPLPVSADREQLKIAFDNIIANAIQSMEHGGTLTVSTFTDGRWVVAGVEDSGGGIRPEDVERIFNPFFTTKEHGTGLGLPITNSIVMRHNGVIEVENKPGSGAVFSVKLPCSCPAPEEPARKRRQ